MMLDYSCIVANMVYYTYGIEIATRQGACLSAFPYKNKATRKAVEFMLLLFIFVIIPICVIIAIPLGIIKAKQDAKEKLAAKLVQEQILKSLTEKS